MIDKIWKLTEKGVTDYNGKVGSLEEVVEVLNTYHFKVNDYLRENNKLREENEQLKQENHNIKHKIEELYYTYIYEPSEHYDEDSCDKIISGILKGVEKND